MSEMLYNIDFSGRIIPGWDLDEVKSNMTILLKADENTILKLFSGKRFVIKKNVTHQTALKINNALKDAGADCEITATNNFGPGAPPPLPDQAAPGQSNLGQSNLGQSNLGQSNLGQSDLGQSDLGQTAQNPAGHEPSPPAVAKSTPTVTGPGPSAIWYVVAALIFLVPTIFGAVNIFNTIEALFSSQTRLMVPGETDIQIDTPGSYVFFSETSGYRGFNMANGSLGRDFDIYLMDLATGEELIIRPAEIPYEVESGSKTLQAVAEIQLDTLGAYAITVEGEIPGSSGLVVMRFEVWELVSGIIWAGVLIFLGILVGPIVGLVVLVKRQRHSRALTNASLSEDQENNWAMWAHISTFCSMVVPLGNFIGPFVIWQLKKHESEFVVDQAKEALNFQISLFIYMVISFVLIFVFIGFLLIAGLVIFSIIIVIVAGVKANEGEFYRYPMCMRLISVKKYPAR